MSIARFRRPGVRNGIPVRNHHPAERVIARRTRTEPWTSPRASVVASCCGMTLAKTVGSAEQVMLLGQTDDIPGTVLDATVSWGSYYAALSCCRERRHNMAQGDHGYRRWFGSTHHGINAHDRPAICDSSRRSDSTLEVGIRQPRNLLNISVLGWTIAAITVCAIAVFPLGDTPPASAAGTPVVSVTPLVDAPGSTAMTIVTVTNVPVGWRVTMTARVGNLPTSCEFRWWHRPGASFSQQCYVTLPTRVGSWRLTGKATLTRAGQPARVYSGSLVVTTQGPATRPVSPSVRALITKCYNTTRNVRLTFDDGYSSQANLNSILATLRLYNVRAVFLPTGIWARSHPAMIQQIRAAGQRLGNHTYSHPHLNGLSNAAFHWEIANGQQANMSPRLLRPPGGAGAYSARSYYLAQAQGYRLCYWGVDTRDWAGVSATTIVNKVISGDNRTPPARAGDAILMHMSNTQSRYALPTMIRALRAKGLPLERLR